MAIKGDKQLQAKLAKLQKALNSTVPKRLGNDARRFFLESFRRQGWLNRGLQPWPPLKKSRTNSKGKALAGRILKGRGLLMNSIRVLRADAHGIVLVAGGQHVRYAKIHNEGGTISGMQSVRSFDRRAHMARTKAGMRMRKEAKVRAFTRRMNTRIPQRRFMGQSHELEVIMRKTILKTVVETLLK